MQRSFAQRAPGFSLRELVPQCQVFGDHEVRITSCCSDSRQVKEGDLFVALVGPHCDGHDYVAEAVARGASAVLAERLVPSSTPVAVVSDTRQALGHICQALAGRPARRMNLIGVTGTIGKTVTCLLAASVWEAAGAYSGVLSTLGYSDSRDFSMARRTTPAAPELAHWLSRMAANGCENGVVELSSDALSRRHSAGIELDIAILTNLRRDHLDRHGTLQNYRTAKARIFEHLKPSGVAILNLDDPVSCTLLNKIKRPVMTVGIEAAADLTATVVERHAGEQTFLLTAGHETAAIRTRMVGDQHVYNCLSAAAAGLVAGISLSDIVRGLEAVQNVPGRLQPICCGQPFQVYVDYARTADALSLCLSTVRRNAEGRVLCVYGAAGESSAAARPALGRAAERFADVNIITSTDPRGERPLDIANDILDGYRRPAKAQLIPDRERAITWALENARPGDAVVLAGKGHETMQQLSRGSVACDDAAIAESWLRAHADDFDGVPTPRAGATPVALRLRRSNY